MLGPAGQVPYIRLRKDSGKVMNEIERFLEYLTGDKGYSPQTVSSYGRDLTLFHDFLRSLDEGLRWADVDRDLVRRWVVDELGRGVSPRSVRRRLSAVRSFYRYLMKLGICTRNPAHCVQNPKAGKPLPAFLKEAEMDRLLDNVAFGNDFAGRRDRLILLTLYTTGIRVSELRSLTVEAVSLQAGELKVTGKRNKQRIIPFGPELAEAVGRYLPLRAECAGSAGGPLFVTPEGKPLRYDQVRQVVRTYLAAVTSQEKKSPHVLRHTFATVMLNNGAELEAVRELLGHASLAATEVYTHTTFAELKQEYEHAHPRA